MAAPVKGGKVNCDGWPKDDAHLRAHVHSRGAKGVFHANPRCDRGRSAGYLGDLQSRHRHLAVYTETAATLDDRRAWFATRRAGNFPVLVADDAGIVGFASFGDFRPWPGYALTVEHSVYVHEAE